MCVDPVTAMAVGSFLVSSASSMVGYQAQVQEADRQTERYYQNHANALAAGRDEQKQGTLRQMQEQEATAQKDHVYLVQAAERESEVAVSAAGANVAGLSVDNLIGDVIRKTSFNRVTLQRNAEMTAEQLQVEKDASVNRAQSRINSMSPGVRPSPAGVMLEIAGAGVKLYGGLNK